jgi:hypothetical protein
MADFSIGMKKLEAKTLYTVGTAAPTGGEDLEIRLLGGNWSSQRELKLELMKLADKMLELGEPKEVKARN